MQEQALQTGAVARQHRALQQQRGHAAAASPDENDWATRGEL